MTHHDTTARLHQIGAVEDQVGLSQRTIRHYDEVGLVTPSGRSPGGFRLYTDDDVARLKHIKAMKPLGFTLEESGDLLRIRDQLERGEALSPAELDYLTASLSRAEERCAKLARQLDEAKALTATMRAEIDSAKLRP
ncbi:MAG: MerR family transcriptional regulator [Microthrixaceae bacterium]|mgnify:CR=1 FL=1|nr:MerR family transcriptional regulator [Microthrixaceae bacterium]MCO5314263.1 MerR family transcriptional regulator [Microthrixaceae bacterium]HPB44260.1 MerR family transcriptional regulator [Microthrixaceae bacterium]